MTRPERVESFLPPCVIKPTDYDRLGIEFDSCNGEAFYNDKMDEVVEILEEDCLQLFEVI